MRRSAVAGIVVALVLVAMIGSRAGAVNPVYDVQWVGGASNTWNAANAWKNVNTNTIGNSSAIFGQGNGSDGMNTLNMATTRARNITIPAGTTVNYPGQTIGDLRIRQGSNLTLQGTWVQNAAVQTENSWTQIDPDNFVIDGGSFQRIGQSTGGDGGGIVLFASYRSDDNFGPLGAPSDTRVVVKNGGSIINNGQLWFGADDEHSVGSRVSFDINNGTMDLTGGTIPQSNSTLSVAADLAFFYDYYRDATYIGVDVDPPPQPKREQWEINFSGPGSITVDSAGIWVYEQDEFGVWNEGSAGPLSYQDLWNKGILKANGVSGLVKTVPSFINGETVTVAGNFNDFFTVSGTPGTDDYTLTSIVQSTHKVEWVGGASGNWNDANAWKNVSTNTTGNAAAIFGQGNGSDGRNSTSASPAGSRARDITIPQGTTVNYPGQTIGDLRIRQGSNFTVKGTWVQNAAVQTENSWTQMDPDNFVIDGGSFQRIGQSTGGDGGGIILFASYRSDDNFGPLGAPSETKVVIKNGGSLINNGQLWFGADDEHSVGSRVSFTINEGTMDLTGGTIPQSNSTLSVAADMAFFYDYYRDATYIGVDVDPPPQPKKEEWEINFTGPGSITVDSAGIWVYEQDEFGVWNEGSAGPLSYQDLWNKGILKANGLSGKTGTVPSFINGETVLTPANFNDFFTVTGTPGTDDYILNSLIEAGPDDADADYNDDGTIDSADYVAWRKLPGNYGGDPAGYNLWVQQFGQSSPGAGGSGGGGVPEPSTMLLTLLGLAAVAATKRQAR